MLLVQRQIGEALGVTVGLRQASDKTRPQRFFIWARSMKASQDSMPTLLLYNLALWVRLGGVWYCCTFRRKGPPRRCVHPEDGSA